MSLPLAGAAEYTQEDPGPSGRRDAPCCGLFPWQEAERGETDEVCPKGRLQGARLSVCDACHPKEDGGQQAEPLLRTAPCVCTETPEPRPRHRL